MKKGEVPLLKSKVETKNKKQDIWVVVVIASLLITLSLGCFLKKDDSFSESERRELKQFPAI